jgi:hypothetical protein
MNPLEFLAGLSFVGGLELAHKERLAGGMPCKFLASPAVPQKSELANRHRVSVTELLVAELGGQRDVRY